MKKTVIVLVSVVLSFVFLFVTFVGYAAFTDSLTVQGEMDVGVQDGVFIIGTDVPEGTNASVTGYTASIMNSTVTLGNASSSVGRIEVTVFNGTNEDYGYNALLYSPETGFDNSAVSVKVCNMDGTELERKTEVKAGESFTFYAEFTYVDGVVPDNKTLHSVLNFDFLPISDFPVEKDETTVSGAMQRLEQILESPTESVVLENAMNSTKDSERGNDTTYISNVPGAGDVDTEAINGLFVGNLNAVIDNVNVDVKILIKNEKKDKGLTDETIGDELIIYMTTDDLMAEQTGSLWGVPIYGARDAVVYKCVFTKVINEDGTVNWQQGSMVAGTAPICDYGSGLTPGWSKNDGSFNTDNWKPL